MRKLFSREGRSRTGRSVEQFESATAEVLGQHFPSSERATLLLATLLVVGLIVFICVVKLDRIVQATGRLVPIGGTVTVAPLESQVISRVMVAVGDVVKKGQRLAICDPTLTDADRARLEDQAASADSLVRRLTAEEGGKAFVPQPSQRYDEVQDRLIRQRRTELGSNLADFDQRISATLAQISGLHRDIADLQTRLKIVNEQEDMNNRLSKEGYVSRLQLLTVQDQQVELGRTLADSRSNLESTEHTLASLREQRKTFLDHWHNGNLADLVSARNALESARQELNKAVKMRELVDISSPMDAVVTYVPQLTTGGVATGAQPMFGLVPLDAPLEAVVQIEPLNIGFVQKGDRVNLKFDAYKFLEHGVGHGVVTTFSQDSFSDSASTAGSAVLGSGAGEVDPSAGTHFVAHVRITSLDLHELRGPPRLTPGMTLQADIVVGERTIVWYLLGGALRSGAEAMHEP